MNPINVPAAMQAAAQAKATLQGMRDRRVEIDKTITDLSARSLALFRAPLNRDDMKQLVLEDVDRRANRFREEGLKRLVAAWVVPAVARPPIEGELRLEAMSRRPLDRPYGLNLQDLQAQVGGASFIGAVTLGEGGQLNPDAVCFWMGDQLKQVLADNFERLCPEVMAPAGTRDLIALSIQARRDEMQAIEAEIESLHSEGAEIDRQIEEMVTAMNPLR